MSKVAPLPHLYSVSLSDGLLHAPPRAPIALGPPPQFGGSEQRWSPEELLIGAALECLWTTFEAYARRDALEVRNWSGTGTGVLSKGSPVPVFTSITLQVELTVAAADEEKARTLLATAEQRCIISRALDVPITVTLRVLHA